MLNELIDSLRSNQGRRHGLNMKNVWNLLQMVSHEVVFGKRRRNFEDLEIDGCIVLKC